MANPIELRIRDDDDHIDTVDLDLLTPPARALAETWHAHDRHRKSAVFLLQASGVRRDRLAPADRDRYAMFFDLDAPDSMMWDSWSTYPIASTMPAERYLEGQARRLPTGYAPIGGDFATRVPSAGASLAGEEWLTVDDVLVEFEAAGRPITRSTWRAYVSRGQAPSPGRRVGPTPQWRRAQVRAMLNGKD